jgi:hypothetical protein
MRRSPPMNQPLEYAVNTHKKLKLQEYPEDVACARGLWRILEA